MIWRTLIVILGATVATTPAWAQDVSSASASSLSPEAPSSEPSPLPAAGLSDAELERAVRAAYTGAAAYALAHGNYFARDGVFPPLRDAIAAELAAEGFSTVAVPEQAAADLAAARVCLAAPATELRIAPNLFGDGVTLVAVTDARYFAYVYDPHAADDIKVIAAADCTAR
ncbi:MULTISPECIES: hypothetical protein [unclassified Devosia]|mgnify:CR=1 FL=1|uniref:hypothetical protein n=1 Tax=unclassified Devosia TaxID=196773 RepID=UPI001AC70704|nr:MULTISPECIES: hypothetical protein [unclassified Devosia]MBN9306382.1 hypothetical protein [Devosia sp.]